AGAAFVYSMSGGTFTFGQKIVGQGEVGAAEFGTSVALAPDDFTLVVGGPLDGANAPDGAAWAYTDRHGRLFDNNLTPTEGSPAGLFGTSVSLVGGGNSGVTMTALVGAPQFNSKAGAVWFFTNTPASGWAELGSTVTPSDESGAGLVGSSVALSADGTAA